MDFLKPEIRNYFFKQEPAIKTKIADVPPAKYNPGATVKNSLVSSGCIINGTIENCIVESRDTIRANSYYSGEEGEVKIVVEKNERYVL